MRKLIFFRLSEIQLLLLEDSTINRAPKSLKNLLISLPTKNELYSSDIFATVLCILAAESGFSLNFFDIPPHQRRNYNYHSAVVNSIPAEKFLHGRDKNGEYRLDMFLGACESFKCALYVKPYCDYVLVNVMSKNPVACFSHLFVTSRYVDDRTKEPKMNTLRELSIKCKDELFQKIKTCVLREANLKCPTISDLPVEMIIYLCKRMAFPDYINLCKTSWFFYSNFMRCEELRSHFRKIKMIAESQKTVIKIGRIFERMLAWETK